MRRSVKVLLLGCGNGIAEALDILVKDKRVIVAGVVARVDESGAPFKCEELIKTSLQHKILVFYPQNINDKGFIKGIKKNAIDLLCNWGHGQRFSKDLISSTSIGSLNLHPGLLPFGRGSGAIQGEVLNKATKLGQTCHLMDEHFDMGIIVAQRVFKISGYEYLDEIHEKLKKGAARFFVSAIYKCIEGDFKKKNLVRFGRYFPKPVFGDTLVDWNQSSDFIVRKVRSRSPELLSKFITVADRKEYFIRKIAFSNIEDYIFSPGQVIDKDARKGILVKTGDNAVWLEEITSDHKKFFVPTFKIGTCFVANTLAETVRLNEALVDVIRRLDRLEKRLI